MLYKGKWVTIDMDEFVPYMYGKPAFTKAKDDELWVVLLEKAWAKLYTIWHLSMPPYHRNYHRYPRTIPKTLYFCKLLLFFD